MKTGDLVAFEFEDIYLAVITKVYNDGAVDAFFAAIPSRAMFPIPHQEHIYFSKEELNDCFYEVINESR